MRLFSVLASLICLTLACHSDPDRLEPPDDKLESGETSDSGGDSDSDGDGHGHGHGHGWDPGEHAEADPWLLELDHAEAWPLAEGFVVAGYDGAGVEIGQITVFTQKHEVLIAEHRYPRECGFNDVDCADVFLLTADYDTPHVDRQFSEALPPKLLGHRTEGLIVLAGQREQELGRDELECALTILPPIAACAGGSPFMCMVAIAAAACECEGVIVKTLPEFRATLERVCE